MSYWFPRLNLKMWYLANIGDNLSTPITKKIKNKKNHFDILLKYNLSTCLNGVNVVRKLFATLKIDIMQPFPLGSLYNFIFLAKFHQVARSQWPIQNPLVKSNGFIAINS